MIELTQKTVAVLRCLFRTEEDRAEAALYLQNDCGNNIWDHATSEELERLWIAVLKLSKGEIPHLVDAIAESQTDYRDVLVMAGFGYDVNEHRRWAEDLLHERKPGQSI